MVNEKIKDIQDRRAAILQSIAENSEIDKYIKTELQRRAAKLKEELRKLKDNGY